MRPAVTSFAIVYGAGLATGLVVLVPPGVLLIGAAVACWFALQGRWGGLLLAAALVGMAVGTIAAAHRRATCAVRWTPGRMAAIVRLHDAPDGDGRATAQVLHAADGCVGRVRVRLPASERFASGARLVVAGTVRPGGYLTVRRARRLSGRPSVRYRLRDATARRIRSLYGPRAPIVEALVLGRRGDVPTELRNAFVDSGLAHLLAISGLHVGLLAGWLAVAARALGAGPRAWAIAGVGVWAYVAFLGFPAPGFRAAAFITLYGIARLRQRHPSPYVVLSVTVLALVTLAPETVTRVGAWLSCAAVWGTTMAARAHRGARPGPVVRLLVASIGATLATAPITAFAFGSVAPVGMLTNLIAVPVAAVAVPGVFASLVLGALFARGAGAALAVVERVAQAGARIPGGHLTATAGVAFAVPWGLATAVAVWLVVRRPTWVLVRRRALAVAAGVTCTVAVIDAWPSAGAGFAVYVLDVGQGDGIAIRTPHGHWLLVDGGPRLAGSDAGRRVVIPFLRRHGVRALDVVMVSHGDADHLGGIPAVLRAVPVARLLEPGQPLRSALYLEHLAAVDETGAEWTPARAGDTLLVDGVTVAVLHPTAEWMRREVRPNENSIVATVSYGAFDLLLTGDIGAPVETELADRIREVEVLKVGHHGSPGSTTEAWVRTVHPRVAVISVGEGNRYGHPARSVLDRFADRGIPVYRTDRGGMVTLRSDGRYFQVEQGSATTLRARFRCLVRRWLRSRASSSSRSACTPKRPASSPTSFTTWP